MNPRKYSPSILFVLALSLSFGLQVSAQSAAVANMSLQTKKPIVNSDVIRLVKNGFADDQVIAVIEASEPKFDVSVDALIELKNAGVSQKLIETILLAGRSPQVPSAGGSTAGTDAATVPVANSAPPSQPYIQIVRNSDRSILPPHAPTMIQTNAKGDNMATILADDSVRNVASTAITSAATTAILAGPGIAAIPILGVAGAAISRLPGLRRDPAITLVYALEGRQSANIIASDRPKFELFFGDVVGANPDDFIPVIVKVSTTNNNWRLTGAQKTTAKNMQSRTRTEFKFIEDLIPSRITKLARGHVSIEAQNPLQPGEYGIALRPTSKTWKVDVNDLVSKSGEGALVRPVWDFAIRSEAGTAP